MAGWTRGHLLGSLSAKARALKPLPARTPHQPHLAVRSYARGFADAKAASSLYNFRHPTTSPILPKLGMPPVDALLPEGIRFSGHESFACRFAWLPKAVSLVSQSPESWSVIEEAMTKLGLGRNMVVSLRFWAEAARIVTFDKREQPAITPFARVIFDTTHGDPYLEMVRTLWLIHWHLTSHPTAPLFAWHLMFGRWLRSDFTHAEFLAETTRLVAVRERPVSRATIDQHFDVFVRSYLAAKSRRADEGEDALDSLLSELSLLERRGFRRNALGDTEPIFVLPRRPRADLDSLAFAYAVADLWYWQYPQERTLTLKAIGSLPNSPGMVFRLTELDVAERVERMSTDSALPWVVRSTAGVPSLARSGSPSEEDAILILSRAYGVQPPAAAPDIQRAQKKPGTLRGAQAQSR